MKWGTCSTSSLKDPVWRSSTFCKWKSCRVIPRFKYLGFLTFHSPSKETEDDGDQPQQRQFVLLKQRRATVSSCRQIVGSVPEGLGFYLLEEGTCHRWKRGFSRSLREFSSYLFHKLLLAAYLFCSLFCKKSGRGQVQLSRGFAREGGSWGGWHFVSLIVPYALYLMLQPRSYTHHMNHHGRT